MNLQISQCAPSAIIQQREIKIQFLDPLSSKYMGMLHQQKNCPPFVKNKLDEISAQIQQNNFYAALKTFSLMENYEFSNESLYEIWGGIVLHLKYITMKKQVKSLLEKAEYLQNRVNVLQKQKNEKYLLEKRETFQKKSELVNLLQAGQFDSANKLAQRIPGLFKIGLYIRQIKEYHWLIERHNAYSQIHFPGEDIRISASFQFCPNNNNFKLFVDQTYQSSNRLSAQLTMISDNYFRQKNFKNSYDLPNLKISREMIKNIFQNHFQKYEYAKCFEQIWQKLVESKLYDKNEFYKVKDRVGLIMKVLDELLDGGYQKSRNLCTVKEEQKKEGCSQIIKSESMIRKQSLAPSYSTAASSIIHSQSSIIQEEELTEELASKIKYRGKPIREIYETFIKLKQQVDEIKKRQNQLNEQITNLERNNQQTKETFEAQKKEIKDMFIDQIGQANAYFQVSQDQLEKAKSRLDELQKQISQLKKENEQLHMMKNNESIHAQENYSVVQQREETSSLDTYKDIDSKILQNEEDKSHLSFFMQNLIKEVPYFQVYYFSNLYTHGEPNNSLSNLAGRSHLWFLLKLQDNKIISIFIERGLHQRDRQNVNRSQIFQDSSNIFGNDFENLNRFEVSSIEKNVEVMERAFIITHWNQKKFVLIQKTELLKMDQKNQTIQIGCKDIMIDLRSLLFKSSTGISKNAAFAYLPHKKTMQIHTLLGGAERSSKFEQLEIFQIQMNNYNQHIDRSQS